MILFNDQFSGMILISLLMLFISGIMMLVYQGSLKDDVVLSMKKDMKLYLLARPVTGGDAEKEVDLATESALLHWDTIQQNVSLYL
jgi:hypothetical protein